MRVIFENIDWSLTTQVLPESLIHYCVHVHRMRRDDPLTISDGAANEATFILDVQDEAWTVTRTSPITQSHNGVPIMLFCGLPKGDKLDRITRQVSELGIDGIVILKMARNVVQLDSQRARKRLARLERVALEAARQSERSRVLSLGGVYTFSEGIKKAADYEHSFYFHPGQSDRLPPLTNAASCAIFVGPEGGFSDEERSQMDAAGIKGVHLGRTVLRTETASVAAVVATMSKMNYL